VIIAIDGPAGSGKSTTAQETARRLGFHHLDSGAFYRALTLAALRAGIPPERWADLAQDDLDALGLEAEPADRAFRMRLHGRDVSAQIRSAEVTAHVSRMAAVATVRHWLLPRLRRLARHTDVVSDGRDIGTVVFPDAELKVFLTAEPETRARRRLAQHGVADPGPAEVEAEIARLLERDRKDSARVVAPLRKAPDAVGLDTTRLSFDEQVDAVVRLARQRLGARAQVESEHGLDADMPEQ
jgi:cytidylate kinase